MMVHQMKLLEKFRDFNLNVACHSASLSVCKVDAKSALRNQIREAQRYDHQLQESKE
jgi:hypothetical protein